MPLNFLHLCLEDGVEMDGIATQRYCLRSAYGVILLAGQYLQGVRFDCCCAHKGDVAICPVAHADVFAVELLYQRTAGQPGVGSWRVGIDAIDDEAHVVILCIGVRLIVVAIWEESHQAITHRLLLSVGVRSAGGSVIGHLCDVGEEIVFGLDVALLIRYGIGLFIQCISFQTQ